MATITVESISFRVTEADLPDLVGEIYGTGHVTASPEYRDYVSLQGSIQGSAHNSAISSMVMNFMSTMRMSFHTFAYASTDETLFAYVNGSADVSGYLNKAIVEFVGGGEPTVELSPLLRATSGDYDWDVLPISKILRSKLALAVSASTDRYQQGGAILYHAKKVSVYNSVNQLNIDVYTDFSRELTRSIRNADLDLQPIMHLVPKVIQELKDVGVPDIYLELFYNVAASDSPVARVSAVATVITLAAIYVLAVHNS